jgi:hypothetical protein
VSVSLVIAAAIIALWPVAGAPVQAVDGETVADPVRVMLPSPDLPATGNLIRITRDYNNDGLEDIALGFDEACGNKTCWFELFLRTRDGRYKHVGGLGGLPFAYRLVPLSAGKARWETCAATGDEVGFSALAISMDGVVDLPGRSLSEAEADVICRWPGEYTWELCDLDRLRSAGGCSWVKRSWPR